MSIVKKYIVFLLILVLGLGIFSTSLAVDNSAQIQNVQVDKARLEAELAKLEAEIAAKQKELDGQKGQSVSISRDISILTTQINKSKLDIKAKDLTIQKLGGEIVNKNKKIQTLTEKIETEKESLAQLIRKDRELDDLPVIALILSRSSLSDAYSDINNFASIKNAVKKSVDSIRGVRTETQTEKQSLEEKKNKETDVKYALENEKKKVEQTEAEKKKLLSISKNKESEYQKVLAEKAKQRSAILSALFSLRDTGAIPFGKALEYANEASKVTGVRPAFILAILTQESNLGTDQGSCYVTNMETGAGKSSRSQKDFPNVIHPTRDLPPFRTITASLGRDYKTTLVSCPIGGIGYGGAMGPAQFIPSTWMGMRSKVATALGKSNPDPWNARDAFFASALFLKELGANKGGYSAESEAAGRYYAGSRWNTLGKPYSSQVMAKALKIQTTMIDPLQN